MFLAQTLNYNHRLICWPLLVQGNNIQVCHKKGADNTVADTLSPSCGFPFDALSEKREYWEVCVCARVGVKVSITCDRGLHDIVGCENKNMGLFLCEGCVCIVLQFRCPLFSPLLLAPVWRSTPDPTCHLDRMLIKCCRSWSDLSNRLHLSLGDKSSFVDHCYFCKYFQL